MCIANIAAMNLIAKSLMCGRYYFAFVIYFCQGKQLICPLDLKPPFAASSSLLLYLELVILIDFMAVCQSRGNREGCIGKSKIDPVSTGPSRILRQTCFWLQVPGRN